MCNYLHAVEFQCNNLVGDEIPCLVNKRYTDGLTIITFPRSLNF